ncbi:hypothetical protein ACHHYP_08005 [Achlya hypogyna]|uniref:Uncharacterized protein n=1 Tax=Achlya hypogyna TaxID=1202772 RepID=A0A1V9YQ18_ACHHY|nr:hypothetical protein ACHHYP_08005 [Achlya hypogyna]
MTALPIEDVPTLTKLLATTPVSAAALDNAVGAACLAKAYPAFMALAAAGALDRLSTDQLHRCINLAVEGGSVHVVAALLRLTKIPLGSVCDSSDGEQMTPVLVASITGDAKMLQFLLNHNDVDANLGATKDGNSPLGMAAAHGHKATVAQLLAANANPHYRNLDGDSVMDLADMYGQTQVSTLLRQHARVMRPGTLKSRIQCLRAATSYRHYTPHDSVDFNDVETRISLLKIRASECQRPSQASTPASSSDDERFRSFF